MSRLSVPDIPMRAALLALLSLVVLMFVPGADAAPEGRVVVAVSSEPTTFDAHVFSDQPTYNVMLNVFDTLVERGPDMQLRPLLAESYRLVDDRTWQFKLRKGIQFTNGEPFNAQVVKWNVERMLDPATKSKNIGRVSSIERVEVVDDLTVNIRTKNALSDPRRPARPRRPHDAAALRTGKGRGLHRHQPDRDRSVPRRPVGQG